MNKDPSVKSDYCYIDYNKLPTELSSPTVDFAAPKNDKNKLSEFKRKFVFVVDISTAASEIDFTNYVLIHILLTTYYLLLTIRSCHLFTRIWTSYLINLTRQ